MRVRESEREWAKKVGLKKTDLIYFPWNTHRYRVIYRDAKGNCYYIGDGHFFGVPEECCEERVEGWRCLGG